MGCDVVYFGTEAPLFYSEVAEKRFRPVYYESARPQTSEDTVRTSKSAFQHNFCCVPFVITSSQSEVATQRVSCTAHIAVCWEKLSESHNRIRGDNVKEGHTERGHEGMDCIHPALGRGQRRVREKVAKLTGNLRLENLSSPVSVVSLVTES